MRFPAFLGMFIAKKMRGSHNRFYVKKLKKHLQPQAAEDCFRTVFRRFSIFRQGRCITTKYRFLVHLPWRKIEYLLKTVIKQSPSVCAYNIVLVNSFLFLIIYANDADLAAFKRSSE